MKSLIALMIFSFSFTALAQSGSHNLVLFSEATSKKLSLTLPSDLNEAAEATISISLGDDTEKILMNSLIKNLAPMIDQQTHEPAVGAIISIDLGRSGTVSILFEENYKCRVQSTLRHFYFPTMTEIDSCFYFFSTGPKPGMSGSN